VVNDNANVRLSAGEEIILKPGTRSEAGGEFFASISSLSCDALSGPSRQAARRVTSPPNSTLEDSEIDNKNLEKTFPESQLLTVTPNLASLNSQVRITVEGKNEKTLKTISIYSLDGKRVLENQFRGKTLILDTSNIGKSGVYIVKVGREFSKLIIN